MTTQSHLPSRPTLYSFFLLIPLGLNNVNHIFLVKVKSLLTLFHPSFDSMNLLLISAISSAVYSVLKSSITSSQSTSNVAGWNSGLVRGSRSEISFINRYLNTLNLSITSAQSTSNVAGWSLGPRMRSRKSPISAMASFFCEYIIFISLLSFAVTPQKGASDHFSRSLIDKDLSSHLSAPINSGEQNMALSDHEFSVWTSNVG
ncbi:hypothetical protein P167DRAFT_575277 [Morchella conica CCBAS932]|uniref:Uncharacterized protein n=1 Tax=Morchella conica CCBAS932 TaxID=1392247 RepID=A0A3N4KLU2_9PEZI|nr:hypothetical protein P167DRAFT_575277 [Morchella conica CCBAS932]